MSSDRGRRGGADDADTGAPAPPIAEYAFIGDCHTAALISRDSSIDWCCFPRFDSGSAFGRLLDWERGGWWSIRPTNAAYTSSRDYLKGTLVLATTFAA